MPGFSAMRHVLLPASPAPVCFVDFGERVASSRICCADIYLVLPVFLAVYSANKRPDTLVRLIHRYTETNARDKMDMRFYADANLDFLLD